MQKGRLQEPVSRLCEVKSPGSNEPGQMFYFTVEAG